MWEYNYDCQLFHDGTKGMKWGQRLYQNKDGSLTPLGRLRYGKKAAKRRKAAAERAKAKAAEKKNKETVEQKKQTVLKSRSAKELYKNADLFNYDELDKAYKRLQLEKNIKDLSPEEVSKGKQIVDKTIAAGKTLNDAANTSIDIYNNVARVYNAFTSGEQISYIPKSDGGKKKKKKKQNKNDDND